MCRTWGASPSGALASSAARWRTPKRCCSSTTATARRSNSTASSISAWVPTMSFSSPVRELAQQVGAPRRGRGAGQQRDGHQLAGHERLQRGEVLLGERLGGRHERRLHAVLDGAQHRVQGDDGLARADLAHEQALHRALGGEIGVDLVHRGAWSPVGVKGSSVSRHARVSVGSSASGSPPGGAPLRRAGAAGRPGRPAARRRPAARGRPRGRRSARRRARPARSGRRSATRRRAGSGSTTSATASRCSRTAARICVEVMPLVAGYCATRLADRRPRLVRRGC